MDFGAAGNFIDVNMQVCWYPLEIIWFSAKHKEYISLWFIHIYDLRLRFEDIVE